MLHYNGVGENTVLLVPSISAPKPCLGPDRCHQTLDQVLTGLFSVAGMPEKQMAVRTDIPFISLWLVNRGCSGPNLSEQLHRKQKYRSPRVMLLKALRIKRPGHRGQSGKLSCGSRALISLLKRSLELFNLKREQVEGARSNSRSN